MIHVITLVLALIGAVMFIVFLLVGLISEPALFVWPLIGAVIDLRLHLTTIKEARIRLPERIPFVDRAEVRKLKKKTKWLIGKWIILTIICWLAGISLLPAYLNLITLVVTRYP